MTGKSDVRKLVETETDRLGFTMELVNGRWLITNPKNGRTGEIPLQAMGRGLDNYKTKIRSLLHDHPTKPSPMVAATDPAPEKADTMPRDTWWSVEALLAAAYSNGLRPYVSGGNLHTPGPIDAQPFAEMLHARKDEVIAQLTKNTTATTEGDTDVPKIGDTATVVRSKSRNIFADAEALWGLLRDAAREQGDKSLTNGGVVGVQWQGALSQIIKAACPDWDTVHEQEVRQYLNRTEHTRCHRPRANPPVWWIATEWNDGNLTITKTTPKPDPRTVAAAAAAKTPTKTTASTTPTPAPATPITPPITAGPALRALIGFEQAIQRAETQRDEAVRERDLARAELEEVRADLIAVKADRDQVKAELAAINAVFARYGGDTA